MKKLIIFALIGTGLFLALGSCEKEDLSPEYPFSIEVLTFDDSIRVTNAYVEVLAPVQGNQVLFLGYTNELGRVNFKYDKEAILMVRATRGPIKDPTYIGCNEVRLSPNETVVKKVYIKKADPEIPGC